MSAVCGDNESDHESETIVNPKVIKSDSEWREQLTPEQYEILRRSGTERPFRGKYAFSNENGTYRCAACDNELFSSNAKFESGTGWPSFAEPAIAEHVELITDHSHGMTRTEVRCRNCGWHLGHVFDDGPGPNVQRYCINSAALELQPAAESG